MDSGFLVLDSGFLVRGTWIPDSNRLWDYGFLEVCIPYSKAWDSGFQSFVGLRIP